MRRGATALGLALVLAASTAWAEPGATTLALLDDDAVRERTRAVLDDRGYQTERPDGTAAEKPPPKLDPPDLDRSDRPRSSPVEAPAEVSQALIWIVLGGILLFVIALLLGSARRSLQARRIKATPTGSSEGEALTELDPEQLDETLRAALALAAAGRFEEAVHHLLKGAIAELQSGAGLPTEVALTSRELLAQANLRPDPRSAFRDLVLAVELSLFGGLPVTREDFDRCADSFRLLRQAVAQ